VGAPSNRPALAHFRSIALVAAGGVLGAPARYAISQALPASGRAFPTATFIANLSGALLLGLLLEALVRRGADVGNRRTARLLLGTGFCGAYTTYSTLAVDTVNLARAHRVGVAVAYAVGSVILGLLATAVGIAVGAAHHRWAAVPADPDRPREPDRPVEPDRSVEERP
jgi:CrcB protein